MINEVYLEDAKGLPPITRGMILNTINFYIDFFEEYLKTGHSDSLENKSLSPIYPQVNHRILDEFERTICNFHPQMMRNNSNRNPFDPDLLPTTEDTLNILKDLRIIRQELMKTMPKEEEKNVV